MSIQGLKKLQVWVRAKDYAVKVYKQVLPLLPSEEKWSLNQQLRRSSVSISANIAEGYGRYSQAAYRNHLSIARGSAFESESWLDLLIRRKYVSEEAGEMLLSLCIEIQKLVTYRMKSLSSGKTYALKDEGATYET